MEKYETGAEPFTIISTEEYFEVAHQLKADLPYSAMMYNTLLLHARGAVTTSSFYRLRDHQDSTVVLSICHVEKTIYVHCCKSKVELLTAALKKTSLLDFYKLPTFCFIPDYLMEAVQEFLKEREELDMMSIREFRVFICELQPETPLRCGRGRRLCRLGKAGVRRMVERKGRGLSQFLSEQTLYLVGSAPSVGVYPDAESRGEAPAVDASGLLPFAGDEELPLCYASTTPYGAIGYLRTEEGHKRRGLARLVVQALARLQEGEGYAPYCYVRCDNEASLSMFRRAAQWREVGSASVLHPAEG